MNFHEGVGQSYHAHVPAAEQGGQGKLWWSERQPYGPGKHRVMKKEGAGEMSLRYFVHSVQFDCSMSKQ